MDSHVLKWQMTLLFSCITTASSLTGAVQHATFTTDCTRADAVLTCNHDLPEQIPAGVTDVYITDYNHKTFAEQKHVFENQSWQSVIKLDIIVNLRWKKYQINNYEFAKLENLKSLGVHTPKLHRIKPNAFAGLSQLVHLDLSDCASLGSSLIISSLSANNSTPNLDSLNLKGFQRRHTFEMSKEFLEMLQMKSIKHLSLSGTNVVIGDYTFRNHSHYALEYLDMSNTTIIDISTRIKNKTVNNKKLLFYKDFFSSLKILNVSRLPERFFDIGLHDQNNVRNATTTKKCLWWPANLETLDISYNEKRFGKNLNNVTVDYSICPGKFKTIIFRGNRLQNLNATMHWPKNATITTADLSFNEISYISPNLFSEQGTMQNFLLSSNNLSQMDKIDFGNILKTFDQLEQFEIAFNDLKVIPYDMFANNSRLKVIDLKGNKLESVTFYMEHLTELQHLDLASNNIMNIDGKDLLQLKYIQQFRTETETDSLEIDFHGNPLQCSCNSMDFITWLENSTRRSTKMKRLQCRLDGDLMDIDTMAVKKTEYLCHRTFITVTIVASVSAMTFVVVLTVFIAVRQVRRKKRNFEMRKFLQDIKNKQEEENKLLMTKA